MNAIDAVATALCNYDEQRHRRLEDRDPAVPCHVHVMQAWTAVTAVVDLLQREVGTEEDAAPHGEAHAVLRQIYGVLTAEPTFT